MKYVVMSIRDVCADGFARPFFEASVGTAQRAFADAVNRPDENNNLYKHPEHFELYHLGFFDDADASFDLFPKPRQLMLASNCVTQAR